MRRLYRDRRIVSNPKLPNMPNSPKEPRQSGKADPARPLSTGQVARYCGFSTQHAIRQCDGGSLPSHKLPGSKFRRVLLVDLIAYMRKHGLSLGGLPPELRPPE